MVITKLSSEEKENRYNIYLNDAFAFGVDEATVCKVCCSRDRTTKSANRRELNMMIVFNKEAYQRHCTF